MRRMKTMTVPESCASPSGPRARIGFAAGVRSSLRRIGIALFAVAILVTAPAIAGASRGWCRADPQFLIGGQLVRVTIDAQVGDMRAARALSDGPITLELTVPHGVRVELLASGNGFGDGYDVSIAYANLDGATVEVAVIVPFTDDVPIRVSIIPAGPAGSAREQAGRPIGDLDAGYAEGMANERIVLAV